MNAKMPEHPSKPQWQTFNEWVKMRSPQSMNLVKTEKETQEEAFERFGLTDEQGGGWGDASEARDAGWGAPNTAGGGW